MNQVPNEALEGIQTLLNSVSDTVDWEDKHAREAIRVQLRSILGCRRELVTSVFEVFAPLLPQLPADFLDILGEESQRHLNLSGEQIDDNSLGFVEESLLRSSGGGRWSWITLLAIIQSPSSLDIFVREIIESSVVDPNSILTAFAPLMQRSDYDADWIFPGLFEGINNSVLAPVVFDLANYCFRAGLCGEHPAFERRAEFLLLLENLANRMIEIESDPTSWSSDPVQVSKMISDSVALIVSLCDTMSQLQYKDAEKVIEKVCTIRHRRIRAESAFSLAKLGNPAGQETLLGLVVEPVSRLRVIKYAEELGIADEIDAQFTTPVSLAESELAIWLSQPNQMGVPPTSIDLVDQANMFWPGFDDPVDCFLLRFEYRNGEGVFSNIAIVGPLVHAFMASLEGLQIEDIYSVFAGWHAEHEEIFELDMHSLSAHRKTDLFKLERRLKDYGAAQIQTKLMAVFFGEVLAVAECVVEEEQVVAFVDGNNVRTFEKNQQRPINAELVFAIYKGSKLIKVFNQ